MSTIYFVHAATSAGIPVVKASRATMNEALREAEFELSGGAGDGARQHKARRPLRNHFKSPKEQRRSAIAAA